MMVLCGLAHFSLLLLESMSYKYHKLFYKAVLAICNQCPVVSMVTSSVSFLEKHPASAAANVARETKPHDLSVSLLFVKVIYMSAATTEPTNQCSTLTSVDM